MTFTNQQLVPFWGQYALFYSFILKVDFHLSVWLQERERDGQVEIHLYSIDFLFLLLFSLEVGNVGNEHIDNGTSWEFIYSC